MVAYEFYWDDETGKEHLLGVLPERRKSQKRITEESILNWGWTVIGENQDFKKIYFIQISYR
jgi:hypothetical protein